MTDSLIELWQSTGVYQIQWDQAAMIVIGLLLLYLAIVKKFEPLLLVPIGFGGILANIPGVDIAVGDGILYQLYSMGIGSGLFPLLIFMGVGAMTDFGPLLANPRTLFLGAAAQFGIFATLLGALVLTDVGIFDFTIAEAAAIGHHRRGGWPDRDLRGRAVGAAIVRCHRRCCLFLHGAGATHSATDYPRADNGSRAED